MRRAAALLLALIACAGEEPSQTIPGLVAVSGKAPWSGSCTGPAGGGQISLNAEVEPSVAADPTDPRHLIGAWQQDRWSNGGANGVVSAVTFDGGHTWAIKTVPFTRCSGGTYQRATDPWVSIAPDGTAYQIAYAFDGSFSRAMLVSRSTDRGVTWGNPITLQHDTDPDFIMDKETVTADPLDANLAYAVWDRLTGATVANNPQGTGPAWLARTTDRGETWEAAQQIYDPGPDAQTISNQIVVLPDHTLVDSFMVATQNSSTNPRVSIAIIRSSDRGASWSAPPVPIAEAEFVGVNDPKSGLGIRTGSVVHSIAVDAASGTIYVAWEDGRFSSMARDGIALSKSTDGGMTWSTPMQVNGANAPAFTPSLAVADGGRLGVSYYDLRNDVAADGHLMVTHWLATSSDGGATFSETMVGTPFDLHGAPRVDGPAWFLGDYQALAHAGGAFMPFFVAIPQGGSANVFFRPADSAPGPAQMVTLAARSVQRIWRTARERWRFGTLFK
jgi:hypothetical protein